MAGNAEYGLLRDLTPDALVAAVGVAKAIRIRHVAGLIFTYRCTIACRHCLFNCGPKLPDLVMRRDDAVRYLGQLRATGRIVHVAGGEAMMYWPTLREVCEQAAAEGVPPHFIETNASWCRERHEVAERLGILQDCGVSGLLISADPYHQVFVPPDRRKLAYELAVETFGQPNVLAADLTIEQLQDLRDIGRDPWRLAEHVRRSAPRLVGRAGEELAEFLPDRSLEELANDAMWHAADAAPHCRSEFDPAEMWEMHIDPYGNLQTCCGIVVGNVDRTPLSEMIAAGFENHNELVGLVAERGPYAYLELAQAKGYEPLPAYKQKCHLCWETRKFLRPFYPETFGPAEIYGS